MMNICMVLVRFLKEADLHSVQASVNTKDEKSQLEHRLGELPDNLDELFFQTWNQLVVPEHSVGELKELIDQQERKVKLLETRYDGLVLAKNALDQVLERRRKTFVPELRSWVGNYLEELPNGKYHSVLVPKSYALEVEVNGEYRSYVYMSTGTADQAYLALRMAIADLLGCPTQHQIVMFTCYQYLVESAKSVGFNIVNL